VQDVSWSDATTLGVSLVDRRRRALSVHGRRSRLLFKGNLICELAPRARTRPGPHHLIARRLRPRPGAVAPRTPVNPSDLFTDRVFANGRDGFALANDGSAQYPALSTDGGQTWIDGRQVYIDAADRAEGVGYVGIASPRTFFAYGSSAVDVTTNAGRTWWEAFLGELVVAVVPGERPQELVAYVQQSLSNDRVNPAVTWQYVSHDGGRHWSYSTALGGAAIP
jgi:hypothetical protein